MIYDAVPVTVHIAGMFAVITFAAWRNRQRFLPVWAGLSPQLRQRERLGWLLPAVLASVFPLLALAYPQPTLLTAAWGVSLAYLCFKPLVK